MCYPLQTYMQELISEHSDPLTLESDNAAGHEPPRPQKRMSDQDIIEQWLSTQGSNLLMENYGECWERWQEHEEEQEEVGPVAVGLRQPMRRMGSSDSALSFGLAEGQPSPARRSSDSDILDFKLAEVQRRNMRRSGSSDSMSMAPRRPMRRQGSSESTISFNCPSSDHRRQPVRRQGSSESTISFNVPEVLRKPMRRQGSSESTISFHMPEALRKPIRRQGSSDASINFGPETLRNTLRRQGSSETSLGFTMHETLRNPYRRQGSSESSIGSFCMASDSSLSLNGLPSQRYGLRQHMRNLGASDSSLGAGMDSSDSSQYSGNYSSYSSSLTPVHEDSILDIKGSMFRRQQSFDQDDSIRLFSVFENDSVECSQSQVKMPVRQASNNSMECSQSQVKMPVRQASNNSIVSALSDDGRARFSNDGTKMPSKMPCTIATDDVRTQISPVAA